MKISLLVTSLLLTYIICSCNAAHQSNNSSGAAFRVASHDSLLIRERLKLKKYALCRCLQDKYPSDSFLLKDGSIEGLMETGTYGNHAYEVVDSFIQQKSSVTYGSKGRKKLYLMRCIDIYEDPELELLIRRLDGETSVSK